jgi:hypothetical protein
MSNIWKEHLDMLMGKSNDRASQQYFAKLLTKFNTALIEVHGKPDKDKAELAALTIMTIQLQTSIAIISKLEAIEAKLN